jgi:hypothetical protein
MAEKGPGATAKPEALHKLKNLLNLSYEEFVKELGEMADDDKIVAAIRAGRRDGKLGDERVSFTKIEIPVRKLHPTQNEIDVDKSLKFQLEGKFPGQLGEILKGKEIVIKAPIITLNGKYIIDGHHRWSRVYVMNDHATMIALNMTIDEDPLTVLKAVQMAIVAKLKDLPVARVEGDNLLKISERKLKTYVISKISDTTVQVLNDNKKIEHGGKDESADYIWGNVSNMQKTSQPVKDAPDRSVMPQTDDAEDSAGSWSDLLKAGVINFKEPVAHEGHRYEMRHLKMFENFNKDTK